MAPQPLEQGGAVTSFIPTGQEMAQRQNLIPLGRLIDFIIQRTYHELTVLAELLPRKTDMDRKIEIYNFSASTRQLFIRLLALVKWANSASKVDKSAKIMGFLDKQSMLFIDTADMLSRVARETLVHARLPNFHIPAAVEILTTGSYSRLPSIIRERIVPPDPITAAEKRQTLQRLNQVIQHRLVTGNLLPQLRKFRIENGRVTFKVDHEFEVSLTVMGDAPTVPWRLLDIDFLVEDKETGDGKALVHPLQVNYIHQLIQGRIVDCIDALAEVYSCLHYFCQSLQLEVLYTQTLRLMRDRLDDHIHVDEYIVGSKLTVSYWRELTNKDPKSELGYRLTIQTDPNDCSKQLAILHVPSIGSKEADIADRAVRSDLLSMERLLVHTVYVRSLARLNDVKTELQHFLKDVEYNIHGTPAMLTVPVLNPCLRAEHIYITVDTHTGMLRCHVPKHLDCPIMPDMQHALNNDWSKLQHLISELRYWITQRRCEKTLQHLPATTQDRLPLVFPPNHPITRMGPHKVFIQLYRHANVILIVELKEKKSCPNEMTYSFYVVLVKPSSVEEGQTGLPDGPQGAGSGPNETGAGGMPKLYLRVLSLIEFDTFVATHGPGTPIDETPAVGCSKRKLQSTELSLSVLGPPMKQQKTIYPAYFIPELAHVVAMCDEKLPFVALAKEFSNRRIPHGGLQVEANATSLVLKLLTLPQPKPPQLPATAQQQQQQQQHGSQSQQHSHPAQTGPDGKPGGEPKTVHVPPIDKQVWNALLKRLLSVSVRAQVNKSNQTRLWTTELVFYGSPLPSLHHKEQGMRRAVYLQYEMLPVDSVAKVVDLLLNDWSKIVYLYTLVHEFHEQLGNEKYNLQSMVTIKSYSYTNLLLAYGPKKEVNVNICWDTEAKEFKLVFTGGNSAINAHSMMRDQLQAHLNHNYNLAQIVHMLHETYQPLSSIAKLPIIPHLAILQSPKIPVLSFCIIPQSPTLLRISFQGVYCLEVRFRGGGLCTVRDGAYSRFDRTHVVEEFTPTQGLKGFLSKYVDETAVFRRRSQSEDDNPPSPVTMEDPSHATAAAGGGGGAVGSGSVGSNTFLGGGTGGMRGPQSPRDPGLRFAAPLTPPTGSNPHTPASPHPIGGGGGAGAGGGPGGQGGGPGSGQGGQGGHMNNFNMTSPPASHMPHPSPSGGGLMPSSPLNAQPSPMAAHSPGPSNLAYMQGAHTDGSPFAALSPAASNWPGSPGMPRPSPRPGQSPEHKAQTPHHYTSRVIPARSWAGAIPTLLTYEALDTLCRATPHPQKEIPGPELSPLERFLGSVFMRRQLQRIIHQEDSLMAITSNEPGVVVFKADCLQYQVFLNPNHMQSLHLKAIQLPSMGGGNPMMDGKPVPYQWAVEDLQVLEQFFDQRVAAPPYRPAVMTSFTRMLNLPAKVLMDFIQIMRLDLMPELGQGNKWNVQFVLRMPPSATPIVPVGTTTILSHRQKILFFIQITRIPYLPNMEWKDAVTMLLPMVYDMNMNHTTLAERREPMPPQLTSAVSAHLRRFSECSVLQQGECSLFPAVRDLLLTLTLPNEPPVPGQMPIQLGGVMQQGGGPGGPGVPMGGPNAVPPSQGVPQVGSSPNPMMHSPMQQQQMGAGGGQPGGNYGGMVGGGGGGPPGGVGPGVGGPGVP
ncbi:mediator of RNA polymerase II transcription subunit 14 isoform X2 [Anopheles cruzii]|uniref:mediator of RNA polymerase II transcription subunit 14 isoform X2 n=1 Tax=Anopheles cruzii TaxID=68878 RepID=UPI0022EC3E3D|nr:mediator of RNA polymerase II transcription subunit 14 isoform X2 [Anopheles cruzii]